ncbi:outer membrane lipoprotein carrier protein LolA [Streptomyces sp. NPDC020965]|uniref:outer membrane lipoprotein carrier protein LolA n=1 Tax=Streptomyces sp. NPDC020965 TaxID=3365105 RepID=UPI003799DD6A
MAPNDSAQTTDEATDLAAGRRKAARYFVPVAVAGVAAATIGLVPALAASGDPDLPKISAQELIERIAASETERLSGTVKISTDLGIPSFGGLAEGFLSEGGAGADGAGAGEGSSADPQGKLMELVSGSHTLRVAVDGPDRQKVSILEKSAEYSLIHNGGEIWAYDSATNAAFHAKKSGNDSGAADATPKELPATPKDFAAQALQAAGATTSVTVDGTAQVAGRDAYQLVVKPKQSGSTIGSIKVAVDAKTGTPLKFTLVPSGGGKAVIDVGFTKVDFSRPAASTFDFDPPKGAKVTEADELEKKAGGEAEGVPRALPGLPGLPGGDGSQGPDIIGEGWNSIAKFESPGGKGLTPPKDGEVPAEAESFLDALGDPVSGKFGTGTVFKTRLVNALMTDDGTVYVGAVTKDALVKAANAAR